MAKGRDLRPQQESARDKFAREAAERDARSAAWDGRAAAFDPNDRSDGWGRRTANARQQALNEERYGSGGSNQGTSQRSIGSSGYSQGAAFSGANNVGKTNNISGNSGGGTGLRPPVNFEQLKASTMATMTRGADIQQRVTEFKSRMSGGTNSTPAPQSQSSTPAQGQASQRTESAVSQQASTNEQSNSFAANAPSNDWRTVARAEREKIMGSMRQSDFNAQSATASAETNEAKLRAQQEKRAQFNSADSMTSGARQNSLS